MHLATMGERERASVSGLKGGRFCRRQRYRYWQATAWGLPQDVTSYMSESIGATSKGPVLDTPGSSPADIPGARTLSSKLLSTVGEGDVGADRGRLDLLSAAAGEQPDLRVHINRRNTVEAETVAALICE